MKPIIIIIITLLVSNVALGQELKTSSTQKDTLINWRSVIILEDDSTKKEIYGIERGEGIIDRRKRVHGLKDLNQRELRKIKKEAGLSGANVVYIHVMVCDCRDSEVYYHYLLCTQENIIHRLEK